MVSSARRVSALDRAEIESGGNWPVKSLRRDRSPPRISTTARMALRASTAATPIARISRSAQPDWDQLCGHNVFHGRRGNSGARSGKRSVWALTGQGICFFDLSNPAGADLEFYSFASGKVTLLRDFSKDPPIEAGQTELTVSSDGLWILYTQHDQ